MRPPKRLPAQLAAAPFTVHRAEELGVSRTRTRARDLLAPSRGIRVPIGAETSFLDRCRPYVELTPGAVISHTTAARIHGLFLPVWAQQEPFLHLSHAGGTDRPRRRNVKGHELQIAANDLAHVAGLPVTTMQRTLLDLSAVLTIDQLVVIGDQLVCEHDWDFYRSEPPLVSLQTLRDYVDSRHGSRGIRKLRAALELVRVGADSPPETDVRLRIERSPLPNFAPNIAIRDANGRQMVHPDLSCEEFKTCLEYEGEHHLTPEQRSRDHDRDFLTASLGWHQVIVNKADLRMGTPILLTKIARQLVAGGWSDPRNIAGISMRGFLDVRKDIN